MNNFFLFIIYILIIGLVLFFVFCAHKVAPTGGPEDKLPPEILYFNPEMKSVNILQLEYIEIEFSEPISRTSIINNFWIIPKLKKNLKIKWKGRKKVRFIFDDSLEINQTYVFTLGTGVKDLRNNNLATPFQLAFSTGPTLDTCEIRGRVYADHLEQGVYIYGYTLREGVKPDSIIFEKPKYYTQINKEGEFVLNYLPQGKYRIIALFDRDYNQVYNIGADLIGVPFTDIILDSINPKFLNMNLYLTEEDTIAPEILHIDTISINEFNIKFSEQVTLNNITLELKDSIQSINYEILGWSYDQKESDNLYVYVDDLLPNQPLSLMIKNVTDLAGNELTSKSKRVFFRSATVKDTTKSSLSEIIPQNSSENIPFDSEVSFEFNSPIDTVLFKNCLVLLDDDSIHIPGNFYFENLKMPRFKPIKLLKDYSFYTIQLDFNNLEDLFGNEFADTVLYSTFTTRSMTELGEISGVIKVVNENWSRAIIEVNSIQEKVKYEDLIQIGEEYQIQYLPSGFYLLNSIVDIDTNGVWNYGGTIPWKFSEPFIYKVDTVKVRKRWTTNGIDFNFIFRP